MCDNWTKTVLTYGLGNVPMEYRNAEVCDAELLINKFNWSHTIDIPFELLDRYRDEITTYITTNDVNVSENNHLFVKKISSIIYDKVLARIQQGYNNS